MVYEARNDIACEPSIHNELGKSEIYKNIENTELNEIKIDEMQKSLSSQNHIKYLQKILNDKNNHKKNKYLLGNDDNQTKKYEQLKQWMNKTNAEVICLITGEDDIIGASVQAKHSYSFNHDDIIFDHSFTNCLAKTNDSCIIDFDKFHMTQPIDKFTTNTDDWFSFQ